jgi:hypothetical protein
MDKQVSLFHPFTNYSEKNWVNDATGLFVLGIPWQLILSSWVSLENFEVLHSRVGSWPYPQTLTKPVKACHEETLYSL